MHVYQLSLESIPVLVQAFDQLGWNKPASLFEGYHADMVAGRRLVFVAWLDGEFAGYVTLLWESWYPFFREQGIPEIVDLNVLPHLRNQGIGSLLLDIAEQHACKKSLKVGLGVGLLKDYGAAQRLYMKRGYLPDGKGISYACEPVGYGQQVCADDDLLLWLVKHL